MMRARTRHSWAPVRCHRRYIFHAFLLCIALAFGDITSRSRFRRGIPTAGVFFHQLDDTGTHERQTYSVASSHVTFKQPKFWIHSITKVVTFTESSI